MQPDRGQCKATQGNQTAAGAGGVKQNDSAEHESSCGNADGETVEHQVGGAMFHAGAS